VLRRDCWAETAGRRLLGGGRAHYLVETLLSPGCVALHVCKRIAYVQYDLCSCGTDQLPMDLGVVVCGENLGGWWCNESECECGVPGGWTAATPPAHLYCASSEELPCSSCLDIHVHVELGVSRPVVSCDLLVAVGVAPEP